MKKPSSRALFARLFGASAKGISVEKSVLAGYARAGGAEVCVIGTCDGTYIDNAAALRLAAHVIDCIEHHPKVPIVMLVDSAGQEPNRVAEMLGLASYFGHLLSCLELARRKGHTLITLATGQAVGGAFLCYGMFADRIYALESASVGLMPVEAMSAVTKIPVPVLRKLSKTMPSLEFGAKPFALLGGVEEVWATKDDVQATLAKAIANATTEDNRAALGKKRGGRKLALDIRKKVLAAAAR
ncbi:MAG: biotin-independent malonate decarboxylase subunit gamma [Reyranella sp.]|uniref:biotin-independent malonate decarboxylase subunit gamma n=1 Tax=Reyranella sp. TaxID=1929291 RepID=UPI0027321D8B|nr:biotin-independent malonate decarboxylase subunit gamma [Reyranella sp.]MDP1961550.1 biotin-independent malonate decarboxylase subunit gamma [Reyranella sp.]MDP2372097.1 biotin-independent malonate decarboxylase subunit gamma [Reyranella sp.]